VGDRPLLFHTLEFLALQKACGLTVSDVHLVARVGVPAVRAFVAAHAPGKGGEWPRVHVVALPGGGPGEPGATVGDALRHIDQAELLPTGEHFLLVEGGGVVGDASVAGAWASHARRAAKDPNATLTVCVARPAHAGATGEGVGGGGEVPVFAVDGRDGRVWGYCCAPAGAGAPGSGPAVSGALLGAGGARFLDALTRKGLPKGARGSAVADWGWDETGVYVASPQVLTHFSDNPDYECLRRHYLRFESQNYDMGWRFHVHDVGALGGGVPARAPGAPAELWGAPRAGFLAPVGDPAALARAGARGAWAFLRTGPQPRVALGASVCSRSLLGPRVVVEAGATVEGAVLMEGVVVVAGGSVRGAVVGPHAVVAGTVAPGAVVGGGAHVLAGEGVGMGARVAAATRPGAPLRAWPNAGEAAALAAAARDWEEEVEEEEEEGLCVRGAAAAVAAAGAGGGAGARAGAALDDLAAAWAAALEAPVAEALQSAAADALRRALALPALRGAPACGGGFALAALAGARRLLPTAAVHAAGGGGPGGGAAAGARSFSSLVRELCDDVGAHPSDVNVINTGLEIKALKSAENATFAACAGALAEVMLDRLPRPLSVAGVVRCVAAWAPLVKRFVPGGDGEVARAAEAAVPRAVGAAAAAARRDDPERFKFAGIVLNALLDGEAATARGVLAWAREVERAAAGGAEEGGARHAYLADERGRDDARALLETKFMQMLMSRCAEENEEDEEEEEEEEEEEGSGDDGEEDDDEEGEGGEEGGQ
jgi:hypothetical protein